MFRTNGLPEALRKDNGPAFASQEFEGFLEYMVIDHKKGVLHWSQSDGEVERFNKILLKITRTAQLQREVQEFLFHYGSTPHTVISLSPAELLMGRKLRDKLRQVQSPRDQGTEVEWHLKFVSEKGLPGENLERKNTLTQGDTP